MSDENGQNDWGVQFSVIMFLEKILLGNSNVASVHRHKDILFDVKRKRQGDTLTILCINVYSASLEVVMRAIQEFPAVNAIYFGGKWNKSTAEARKYCADRKVGLYKSGTLPIALAKKKYWSD